MLCNFAELARNNSVSCESQRRLDGSVSNLQQGAENMKTLLAFAAAAVAFFATPAFAQQPSSTVAVSYADLDLSTARGIRKLDRRIRTAVERACGPISSFDPAGKND